MAPGTRGDCNTDFMKTQLATNYPQAYFEQLPAEILLQTITKLYSLDLLWNLMRASPRVWRIFDHHALKVTEGILSGPESIYPTEVQEVIRNVILVRSRVFPYQNLQEFNQSFRTAAVRSPLRLSEVRISIGPERLSCAAVTSTVLRSVVATASHIVALSQACLTSALARIREPSFTPLHCTNPKPSYGPVSPDRHPHNHPEFTQPRAWDREFSGTQFKVVDAGQPSWVEDMRALRAMWVLQLIGEAHSLFDNWENAPDWSSDDVEQLQSLSPVELFDLHDLFLNLYAEETTSALQFLNTLGEMTTDTYCRLPRAPALGEGSRWIVALPKKRVKMGSKLIGRGPFKAAIFNDEFTWGQTSDALRGESSGVAAVRRLNSAGNSPIEGVTFDPFRPFGFAFWDRKRVHQMGLYPGIEESGGIDDYYMFAWESILEPELVLAIKADLRRGYRRRFGEPPR
ncbi:hypothetical protein LIA77_11627 [Sarocladium implicatum]|nr:hypothetical protein LIA77_11627 [Sarocladium implicatum]